MKVYKVLALSVLSFFCLTASAQRSEYKGFPSLTWPKLYAIDYKKEKDNLGEYDRPIFSSAVKALQGKIISLPGYMVPFESATEGNHFILSSTPLNACFFCGVGGPESVIEVHLKTSIKYTEKPIQVRGVLKLNDQDPDKMIYLLADAEFEGLVEL
jgi:hypothetical protein